MPPKTTKPAAAPAPKPGAKKTEAKPAAKEAPKKEKAVVAVANTLFQSKPKNFRIGGDIRHHGRDLSRFVKWPRYVRFQRQKKILMERLKVPPAINQFTKAIDKNQASELMKLLMKYQPEAKAAKAERLEKIAQVKASGEVPAPNPPPKMLKFGLKHITTLIEQKKAKLVVIAHDVDPIELVVWLPALCRKMDVPFCIIKGKSRLGVLTHKKNCAVVALTSVNKEDENNLKTLQENFVAQFNEKVERKWGGGVMGLKTVAKLEKRRKQVEAEEAKKAEAIRR
jgi:large subunit ribosomal protein L7Ae